MLHYSAMNDVQIKSLLSALNPLKATGPDDISGRFLKELHQELTQALTLIFQASLGAH
jgi:hypothetical protein